MDATRWAEQMGWDGSRGGIVGGRNIGEKEAGGGGGVMRGRRRAGTGAENRVG